MELRVRLAFEKGGERDSRNVLHDEVDMVVGLYHIVDFDNVLVIGLLEDLNLPAH